MSGDGRACGGQSGRFIVKDIHLNAAGRVDRFWALFEQHCGEGSEVQPLFGEVRVGEPPVEAREATSAAAVDWPPTAVGARWPVVPIIVVGGETGGKIDGVTLQGSDAGDFRVTGNECEGVVLAPDATCELKVAITPDAAGPLAAELSDLGRVGLTYDGAAFRRRRVRAAHDGELGDARQRTGRLHRRRPRSAD